MGFYINKTSKGEHLPAVGKYQALINDGGQPVTGKEFVPNLVCVVSNAAFDAAGYCFSEKEFECFNEPDDTRRKQWLTHPEAANLSGFNQ